MGKVKRMGEIVRNRDGETLQREIISVGKTTSFVLASFYNTYSSFTVMLTWTSTIVWYFNLLRELKLLKLTGGIHQKKKCWFIPYFFTLILAR